MKTKKQRKNADAQIIQDGAASCSSVPESQEVSAKIAEYKLDLEEYRENEKKLRLSLSLLAFWVDPAIRGTLQTYDNPEKAWDYNQHELLKLDITATGGTYDNTQLVSKILRGLSSRYDTC